LPNDIATAGHRSTDSPGDNTFSGAGCVSCGGFDASSATLFGSFLDLPLFRSVLAVKLDAVADEAFLFALLRLQAPKSRVPLRVFHALGTGDGFGF